MKKYSDVAQLMKRTDIRYEVVKTFARVAEIGDELPEDLFILAAVYAKAKMNLIRSAEKIEAGDHCSDPVPLHDRQNVFKASSTALSNFARRNNYQIESAEDVDALAEGVCLLIPGWQLKLILVEKVGHHASLEVPTDVQAIVERLSPRARP